MMNMLEFNAITVTGSDALKFLQGQLTCDMKQVTTTPSLGAYCDHKGRVLTNFWIQQVADGFCLATPASLSEVTLNTLKKYGAFSQIDIHSSNQCSATISTDRLTYIEQGVAFVVAETSLLFTPQMLNWERLGGVSFSKGCYLGQEIVARTQHLGKLKRHLHRVESNSTLIAAAGDKVVNTKNETIGIICDSVINNNQLTGLAVLHDQALNERLILNGIDLRIFDAQ